MSEASPTIYIVDDDPAVRDALAFLVGSMGYGHCLCASAPELLRVLDTSRPACLVLDVRLPGMSGLELQRELAERKSSARIVFVSGHGDIPKAVRAIRLGAVDFLEKPFDDQVLLDRIGEALAASAEDLRRRAGEALVEKKLSGLTERERKVLRLVIAGKTSKAIALDLDISVKTVENHRHNIMTKADVTSVAQLIAWASAPGLMGRNTHAPPAPSRIGAKLRRRQDLVNRNSVRAAKAPGADRGNVHRRGRATPRTPSLRFAWSKRRRVQGRNDDDSRAAPGRLRLSPRR